MEFDFKTSYPPEFLHVQELIQEARQQVNHMNQGMVNLPDRGVSKAFDRPTEGDWRFGQRNRLIGALEDAKAAYFREILDWVSVEVENADPKIALWVRQSASFDLGPLFSDEVNATKQRRVSRDNNGRNIPPINASRTLSQLVENVSTQPDQPVAAQPNKSAAKRFSESLSFTKITQREKGLPDRGRDNSPDKDRD